MSKFYLSLWLKWSVHLSSTSAFLAGLFSFFITLTLYINQGAVALNASVLQALLDVFLFWFPLVWSITLLIALFRSLKIIFNRCFHSYEMKLLICKKEQNSETIDVVGYGDIKSVWRKWLMLIIWLVGAQMIVALIVTKLFTSYEAIFDWFSVNVLYGFILVAGYISFVLLSSRCRLVKVKRC